MNSTIKHYVQYLNWRTIAGFVFVFVSYFVTAKFFLYIYHEWNTSALIWPPVGIALVAVIFGGYRMWMPIFLAQFLAIYTQPAGVYSTALILAAAYTLQAIVALLMLRWLKFDSSLRDSRSMFILVGITFIVTLIQPFISTMAQEFFGTLSLPPLVNLGRGWGAGIFSVLVITPFVLTWFNKQQRQPHTRAKKIEIAAAMLTLLGIVYFLFWTNTPSYFGISIIFYLPLVLVWFALRFSVRWLTLAVLLASILGIAGTILVNPMTSLLKGQLLSVEIYIGLVAVIFLVFVSIVEERRAALIRLEEAYRSIIAADQAKTDFIAILAHELRNPLAPLVSSAELLKRNPQTKESARAIQSIQEHAGMMSRILDDLLDTARLSHKKFALKTEAVELREMIDQSVQSVVEIMRSHRHKLIVHVPDEEMCLFADPVRVKQVIINLLINAAKYTEPEGTIKLSAKKNKDHFYIEVTDNGIGIEQSMLSHIFEPFKQVDGHGKRGTGLGLGLFLTKCLVEAHEGTIEVKSGGRGRGTTFLVALPVPTEIVTRNKKVERKVKVKGAKPSCILIVDDNKAAADTLAKLLRHYGHTVHVAYSGEDALSNLTKVEPELILLDIGMPDMDGYAVAREIRSRGWTGKIVALSGYGQDVDRAHSKEAGFDDHLLKPVLSDDIIAILERMNVCNEPEK